MDFDLTDCTSCRMDTFRMGDLGSNEKELESREGYSRCIEKGGNVRSMRMRQIRCRLYYIILSSSLLLIEYAQPLELEV